MLIHSLDLFLRSLAKKACVVRYWERLCDQTTVLKLDLNFGNCLQHKLVGILIFELVVRVDLALYDLACVVKERQEKVSVLLNLLMALCEILCHFL